MGSEESSLQWIDRMDTFWRFFKETPELPLDERCELFKARVIAPNLAYYSSVMGINDDGLKQYLQHVEPNIAALRSGQARQLERFQRSLQQFQDAFSAFRPDFEVCLLPSLHLFNGMAVPSQGKISLLLGIDGLAELSDTQYNGYITHELFHAYHYQRSPATRDGAEQAMRTLQMPALWALLWTEGAACHAIRVVYPATPEEELLDWRPLVEQAKPLLHALAAEARRVLRSAAPPDIAGFFYFPRPDPAAIPTGCGYYLGMRVADLLATQYLIDDLLGMDDETLIDEINTALIELQS